MLNRIAATQNYTTKEGFSMRSVAFKALAVGLASLMLMFSGSISTVWAGPTHSVPGQSGPSGGVQFPTPFIISITGLLIDKVTDCATGAAIPPEKLTAEFVFREGAHPPFQLSQLEKIIIKAEGYQPKEITSFMTMQFQFGPLRLIFIIPLERTICLSPLQEAKKDVEVKIKNPDKNNIITICLNQNTGQIEVRDENNNVLASWGQNEDVRVTIDTDGGDDVVNICPDTTGQNTWIINTGSGNDQVNIQDGSGQDDYSINTGSGNDTVGINDSMTAPNESNDDTYNVTTGDGDDRVEYLDSTGNDTVNIQTGNGDDTIIVLDNGAGDEPADNYTIDGGGNSERGDTLEVSDSNTNDGDSWTVTNIENRR
jgi:hypothetical protein